MMTLRDGTVATKEDLEILIRVLTRKICALFDEISSLINKGGFDEAKAKIQETKNFLRELEPTA